MNKKPLPFPALFFLAVFLVFSFPIFSGDSPGVKLKRGQLVIGVIEEKSSRPVPEVLRWDWTYFFKETRGIPVTLTKRHVRCYRGDRNLVDRTEDLLIRIPARGKGYYRGAFFFYGIGKGKMEKGTSYNVFTGVDTNGNPIRIAHKFTR